MGPTFVLPRGTIVATPAVVRVTGLPASVLGPLRFDRTSERISQLVDAYEVLRTDGNSIAGELYNIIGDSSKARYKPELVGLRRALHNTHMPGSKEWNDTIAAVVGPGIARRVTGWTARLAQTRGRQDELPELLANEEISKRAGLRELARHPRFRRALSLSSPALSRELGKWLSDQTYQPRRRSLSKLTSYLARAAIRTSPFSTFTVIGTASWSAGGHALHFTDPIPPVTGVSEMYGGLWRQLTRALCEREGVQGLLRVRVNPSATIDDGTVRFVGPPPKESIVALPASPAVLYCIQLIEDEQATTLDDLRKELGAKVGDAMKATDFVRKLVAAGLVERTWPVADLATDPPGDLADWLTRNAPQECADVLSALTRIRAELASPAPVSDLSGHEEQQRALRSATHELVQAADLPADGMDGQEKEAFFENAVYSAPVATCSMQQWRPALTDLDAVRRLLAAFDPGLPVRVALGVYCRERFGSGARVPLISLHARLVRELSDAESSGAVVQEIATYLGVSPKPATGLADSSIARLRELGTVQSSIGSLPTRRDADHVRRLDPADIEECAANWPDWVAAPRSAAFYVQPYAGSREEPNPLRIVVNGAHGGYGRGRTRAAHLIRRAGGTSDTGTTYHLGGESGDVVLAELGGLFGFTANVRQPGVSHEIDYPFTSSTRPDGCRIKLRDLFVVHDPATDLLRLMSAELDSEVVPVNLGMLSEQLLPPLARLLIDAFGQKSYSLSSESIVGGGGDSLGPDKAGQGVLRQARIEVGRVTIRRARWVVSAEQLPVRSKGQSDADYLVSLACWSREHGIPDRCFARSLIANDGSAGQAQVAKALTSKPNKPLYVDFANLYLVRELERMLHRAEAVAFEEVHPEPGESLDPHVTEVLLELSEGVRYA